MSNISGSIISNRFARYYSKTPYIKRTLVALISTLAIGYLLSFHTITAIGLILVSIFILLSLIRQKALFYIAITSVAFFNIGVFHFGMIDFRPFQFLWLLIFVSIAVNLLIRREKFLPSRDVMIPIFLFILANVASLINSYHRLVTFREIVQVIYLVGVFMIVNKMIRTKEMVVRSVNVILIATSIFVLFGLFSLIFNSSPLPQVVMGIENGLRVEFRQTTLITQYTFDNLGMHRVSSFFLGPVGTACYLVQIMVLILAILIGNHISLEKKALLFLLVLFSLPVFIATFSRAGWIVFLFSLLALIFIAKRGIGLSLLVLFFTIGIISLHTPTRMRLFELLTNPIQEISIRGHFALYLSAFRIFSKNLLWGIGAGIFPLYLLNHGYIFDALGIPLISMDVHNLFLQTAAEVGIVGIIGLFWFIIVVLKRLHRAILIERPGYYRDILIGLFFACIASILMNMTMNAFKVETFFIIFGLSYAASNIVIGDSRSLNRSV